MEERLRNLLDNVQAKEPNDLEIEDVVQPDGMVPILQTDWSRNAIVNH